LWGIFLDRLRAKASGLGAERDAQALIIEAPDEKTRELHMLGREQQQARIVASIGPGEYIKGCSYSRLYGDIVVVTVSGPIYRRADSMDTSGATDTGSLMATVRALMSGEVETRVARYEDGYIAGYDTARKKVKATIFAIDSPGGEATQLDELAALISALGQKMMTVAFIEGLGASAAYYIAAPCKRVVASRMALVGSIGVVMGVPRPAERTEEGRAILETPSGQQYVEFVSAQSKLKRANPDSEEGIAYFQHTVNMAADVFLADVARYRNVPEASVAEKFGYGGVYQASEALTRGMIDEVGGFDAVFERLAQTPFAGEDVGQEQDNEGPSETPLEAQEGDDMPRGKDLLTTIRSALTPGGGTQPGPQAATEGGPAAGSAPLPIKEVLAHLESQREALEQRFTSEAILFATNQRTARKIKPAAEDDAVYEWLTARVDDALYSGTVVFCQRNAAGQLVEVEGTRVQQLEAKYAALEAHSLADERIQSVREGTAVAPVVLNANAKPPGRAAASGQPGEVDFTVEELMQASEQGQRIAKKAQQAPGGSAVN
jgi:ClpP class serine protease